MFTDLKSICVSGWTLIFTLSGWWFGTCFIFPYIGNNNPNWLSHFSEGRFNHQPALNSIISSPFRLVSVTISLVQITRLWINTYENTIFSGLFTSIYHPSYDLMWTNYRGTTWVLTLPATSFGQEVVDYFLRYAEFLLATFPEAAYVDGGDIHQDGPNPSFF